MRYELIGERPGSRRTLWRMALMYTPLAVAAAGVASFSLAALLGGAYGATVALVVLGAVVAAMVYQAQAAWRDLSAEPTFTRGEVARTWTKSGVPILPIFVSHYIVVRRQVFVLPAEMWVHIEEGNVVECHHWPHTKTLIRLLVVRGDADELPADRPLVPVTAGSSAA